jgi:tRNA threonylcarbamoyladenosine modification (KEOPS) complex  Pcc1 subunit
LLHLELRFPYDDERTAKAVLAAVSPENGEYVKSRLEGSTIIYEMEADNAGTLRNTADDLLACIKAAEDSAGLVSEPFIEPEEHEDQS